VEETLRLMAVERNAGRVQVQYDLLRRRGARLDRQIRQQPVDRLGRVADLLIAPGVASQLQPVHRALAGQR
jgi:hypothetical protein